MFCAPGLIFGGIEGVGSRFHVLRTRTRFGRFRGHQVPFSSSAFPDSFWAVPRASGPFMICAPGLNFDGTEGVGSRFHVLCSWTRFRRYRGRRVQFHCFALSESFWVVPRASSTVAMFCAPELIFSGTEVAGSRFLVLRSWNHFGRYRGCRVPFSCFTLLDSFWAVPSVSGPVFLVLRS
jgi:hypothetical protein